MNEPPARSQEPTPKLPPVGKMTVPLGPQLVNHRDVCKAFGISTEVLMRAVKKGEFPEPHSLLGTFYLFNRKTIEHRLEHGTWPKGAKFRGARHAVEDDADA